MQHARAGLTLAAYAAAKALPESWLRGFGLVEVKHRGTTAVRIPYRDETGTIVGAILRVKLDGEARFRRVTGWKWGLYGRERLAAARVVGFVVLVEGESDAQTCWLHGVPAVGIPGTSPRELVPGLACMEAALEAIPRVLVVIEPDRPGRAMEKWITCSRHLRDRAWFVRLPCKDVNELHLLHLNDPDGFRAAFDAAVAAAVSVADLASARARTATA